MKKFLKQTFIFAVVLFITSGNAALSANINIKWFDNFGDPLLVEYINLALECNKDIKIARKNILKYRQEKNLNISSFFPEIDVSADYLLLKIPKGSIPGTDIQRNSFILPFSVNWEVDYLLKNYNKVQKSRLDKENALFELQASSLIVMTDTASAYFNISNLNKQIEEQEKIKSITESVHKRRVKMYEKGIMNLIELNKSENNLLFEKNNLENLKRQRGIFLTELAYLTGKSPYTIDEIKVTPIENINYKGAPPDILKGSIVLNRPDIEKLENEIKKAKIDITIAKKEFLPKITVEGNLVFSTVVNNFGWEGAFAALIAGATQNLFDGGKRIFTLKKRKIEYEIAIENYLKSDLSALKEVNDSLYTLKKDYKVYKNNEKRLSLNETNFVKVFSSYKTGAKSYIDYLNENSNFLNSNMEYFNSKSRNFINLLSLYKAVGGGL